ncbi:unnamed protein product [[Candida] boidinii]|nr:unnamed protein product [[Candida] boidinii]
MQSSMNPYYSRPMLMIAQNSHNPSITSLPPTPNGGGIPLPPQMSTMPPTPPGVIVQQPPPPSHPQAIPGGTPVANEIIDPNAYQQIRHFTHPNSINNTPNTHPSNNQNINHHGSISNTVIMGAPSPGSINVISSNANSNVPSKMPPVKNTDSRFLQPKQNDTNSTISSSSASSSRK